MKSAIIKEKLKHWLRPLFRPELNFAGLEISSTAVRLLQIKDGRIKKAVVPLGPGVIENGLIKNKEKFHQALMLLWSRFGRPANLSVIAILPANNIHTVIFKTPALSQLDFNLKAAAPLDPEHAYYDWQKSGERFLAAFISKKTADEYLAALTLAGFEIAAAEFPALAIARAVKTLASGLVLVILDSGFHLFNLEKGDLAFSAFNEKVDLPVLARGIKKIIQPNASLILALADNTRESERAIQDAFPDLKIKRLALPEFSDLTPSWYASFGGTLRSREMENGQKAINLAAGKTEAVIFQNRFQNFALSWSQTLAAILTPLMVIFLAVTVWFSRISFRIYDQLRLVIQNPEYQEAEQLNRQLEDFNRIAGKVAIADSESSDWSPILIELSRAARQQEIVFSQIILAGDKNEAAVQGRAKSEASTIRFKNLLAENRLFKNINLPLSDVITNKDGSVSFSLTFNF